MNVVNHYAGIYTYIKYQQDSSVFSSKFCFEFQETYVFKSSKTRDETELLDLQDKVSVCILFLRKSRKSHDCYRSSSLPRPLHKSLPFCPFPS